MLIKKELLSQLKDFGLNSYESKLWAALISKGSATAGELSDIANVPRSRSYDVLESLEKKGFIVMKLGKPIKYMAVPPEDAINRIKKSLIDEAQVQAEMLEKVKGSEIISELNSLFNSGVDMVDPFDFSGVLKGRKNIHNHLDYSIKNAQKSVTLVTTSAGILRKMLALKNSLKKAKDRNVKIRIATNLTPETKKQIADLAKVAEIKHTNVKGRFCIIDSKEIVFMVTDDENANPDYDTGVWVSAPLFASSVESFFNTSWQSMKV